jgi:peroxiredoxin
MVSRRWCCVGALVLALVLGISGIAMSAQLGDPASELKVAKWIKGVPVTLAESKGKNILVVEFWATWCRPCTRSIPHLTKLQKKFKDKGVVFVGVSPEDVKTAQTFVKEMGSKMDYRVAVDDRGATTKAYLEAFGVKGIPHAFVVDKEGRIAWHGHPMAGLEEVVAAILAGEYDIRSAQLYQRALDLMLRYYQLATQSLSPDQKKSLAALGERALTLCSKTKNAVFLNNFAWMIMKDESIKERDLELALRAAKTAYDLSEGKVLPVVDTYAWALFENGRVAEAIEMEKQALRVCEDEEQRAEVRRTLQLFEQKTQQTG